MEVKKVHTIRYPGQRPGTSGLRKKTAVFKQPHYLENFVQSGVSEHQGLRILLADNSRIARRLSGTGTERATLRLYLERYRTGGVDGSIEAILGPLLGTALQLLELRERCSRDRATVIT